MNRRQLASYFENRIYDMDLHYADVTNLCYEAKEFGFFSVQVFPGMLWLCAPVLKGLEVELCATISYPHGGMTTEQKVFESLDAAAKGATHLMVACDGRELQSGNYKYIEHQMRAVKEANPGRFVKFIMECEYLKDDQMKKLCEIALKAGVDGLVTSTGLYSTLDEQKNDVPILATRHEIELIKREVGNQIRIQAQGNIATIKHALELIDAGADYLGSRFAASICRQAAEEGKFSDEQER